MTEEIDVLQRALDREKKARKSAERVLEEKATELYDLNQQLVESSNAFKKQVELTQAIFDSAADAIVSFEESGEIKQANISTSRIFGFSPKEIENLKIWQLLPDLEAKRADDEIGYGLWLPPDILNAESFETDGLQADGTIIAVEMTCRMVSENQLGTFTVVVRDVTTKKKLESQLALAQKLESVGRLAAGVAHEVNSPIQFVSHNTKFLKRSFDEIEKWLMHWLAFLDDKKSNLDSLPQSLKSESNIEKLKFYRAEIPPCLEQTEDGVKRIAKIVDAMKDFSHPGSDVKQWVDINQSVHAALTISRNEWKNIARVKTDLLPHVPQVKCFGAKINQVLLNMFVNACYAIRKKFKKDSTANGRIEVATGAVDGYVEIRIRDNGVGIPKKIQKQIFDPFFTTKPLGEGTGQGLGIAHAIIVDAHGGKIELDSEPDSYTEFVILLPIGEQDQGNTNE